MNYGDCPVDADILDLPHVTFFRRGQLPTVGAVYFVVEADRNLLCYVGKAGNLRQRWTTHHRAAQMTPLHRIFWAECEDEVERDRLEGECIYGLCPPWNDESMETIVQRLTHEVEDLRRTMRAMQFDLEGAYRNQWRANAELCRLWAIEADMNRATAYINDVARYMEIDARELVCKILMEWAYNRAFVRRGE